MKIERNTVIGAAAVFCLGMMASHLAFAVKVQTPYMLIMGAVVMLLLHVWNGARPAHRVDIWEHQRYLMQVSGQKMPTRPHLTNDALLYFALQLEELGETAALMQRVLSGGAAERRPHAGQEAEWRWDEMNQHIARARSTAETYSNAIRKLLKRSRPEDFLVPLSVTEAVELLDGVSDQAVVLAGFGHAAGLPAQEGYEEVQRSNASKVNPVSGVIDKDPSGKWIKGPGYFEPSLRPIIGRRLMQADLLDDSSGSSDFECVLDEAMREEQRKAYRLGYENPNVEPFGSQASYPLTIAAYRAGQKDAKLGRSMNVAYAPGLSEARTASDSVYGQEQPGEHMHGVDPRQG